MVQQQAPTAAVAVSAVQEDANHIAAPSAVVTALQKLAVAGEHLRYHPALHASNYFQFLLITTSCDNIC